MFHYAVAAVAAVAITFGTVSELNAKTTPVHYNVKTDRAGRYCIDTNADTGARFKQTECQTVEQWAQDGVYFTHASEATAQK